MHKIHYGKVCPKCKVGTEFHKNAWYCKDCANSNSRKHHARRMQIDPNYREAKKAAYTKTTHGISLQEYRGRLESQDYKCAICKSDLPKEGHMTHLDHCHKTGQLRSFLCTNCNRGLGHFQDKPNLLMAAADYLVTHSKEGTYDDRIN